MSAADVREYDITQVVGARRERVFRAWTDPADVAYWFRPADFDTPAGNVSLDLRPGGEWSVRMVAPDGTEVPLGGTYREVAAPERLVFTTGDPDDPGTTPASVVTVTFADLGDRTRMDFHQAGVNTDGAHAEAARAGWVEFFGRLDRRVTGAGAMVSAVVLRRGTDGAGTDGAGTDGAGTDGGTRGAPAPVSA